MKRDYPVCRKSDLAENHFGHSLPCPYTWLRDTKDPEVKDFTRRENEYTDSYFDPNEIEAMIGKLKKEHNEELPTGIRPWHGGYIATHSHEGNYMIVQLDKDLKIIKTLFRRYDLPKRTPFAATPSDVDENILAIMAQVDGAPRPDNIIYDFKDQKILKILPLTFSGVWSKKILAFYSPTTVSEGNVCRTLIQKWDGTSNEVSDVFAYEGNAIFGSTEVSEDGDAMIFSFSVNYSQDYFYVFDEESGEIFPINPDRPMMLKYVDSFDGHHYFISFENDPRGEVIAIPFGKDITSARTIYKEEEACIEEGASLNGKIFLLLSKDAASIITDLNGNKTDLPETVVSLRPCGKMKDGTIFEFDSFTSSPKLLGFDGTSFHTLYGKDEDTSDLVVEFLKAPSAQDRKQIPYYLVRSKDAEKDGNKKALIYGYGGYNVSMPPWSTEMVSQTNIASWVREGGIYVHCLLRGGNEYGTSWHEEGMGLKKKNCYHDFIGIAEKVISDGWTKPSKIAISGCSNGGLLMSALVTMRPDLWGCVIDSVPHTDMIHFAKDDRGPMYITEYGDPYHSEEEYLYLLSYSPVHNVRDTAYPAVYIQTGECDNNVPPYHGKSFAATMQEHNTSDEPILLRVLELGSHDRGQGEVFWKTIAEMHVFMEKNLK